jgi:FdhD protein
MNDASYSRAQVARFSLSGKRESEQDAVVVEEPLEIRLNGRALAVTMRTPGDDEALAAGFLFTEGIIRAEEDIWDIKRCGDPRNPEALNVVEVVISESRYAELGELLNARQRYASSSCGICGRGSIETVCAQVPPVTSRPRLTSEQILSFPAKLRGAQRVFERTGGLHAAGIFASCRGPLFHAEDIGRHNAVDKVVGKALLSGTSDLSDNSDSILMVSGRAGFEIVQKALAARIPAVCSVSAPSSLAVDLARESGMILIGFLRESGFNVYAGAESVGS